MTAEERVDHECAEHARWMFVDWTLGTTCNFRCSYCPPQLHDGKRPFPVYSHVVEFGRRLASHYGKLGHSVFVQFTGGEVSLYADLPALLSELNALGIRCSLISNGSRGLAFWAGIADRLDSVVLTHHIEFSNMERFCAVAESLSNRIRTHIQITMLPERFAECLERAYALRAACPRATISLKPLRVEFGLDLYDYTAEQFAVLRSPPIAPALDALAGGVRGLMRLTGQHGSHTLSASRILARGLNQWQGWACNAGLELLAIDPRGDVYRGLCREGGCLGNIHADVRLPVTNILCGRPRCACLTDIATTKVRAVG